MCAPNDRLMFCVDHRLILIGLQLKCIIFIYIICAARLVFYVYSGSHYMMCTLHTHKKCFMMRVFWHLMQLISSTSIMVCGKCRLSSNNTPTTSKQPKSKGAKKKKKNGKAIHAINKCILSMDNLTEYI